MTTNYSLNYPTVDLFIYDLAEGLGQSDLQLSQNLDNFLAKIYGKNVEQHKQNITNLLKESSSESLVELLNNKIKKFSEPWDGYYYPIKLSDTYCLQLDCSGPKTGKDSSYLNTLKTTILDHIPTYKETKILGNMGQSWLIWGQLTSAEQDATATAKECYENIEIFSERSWENDIKTQGKIAGATYFELWRAPGDSGTINDNYHTVIILFPADIPLTEAGNRMRKLYVDLIKLFQYRNKVIWAYQQTRQQKKALKQILLPINNLVSELTDINHPQIKLDELSEKLSDYLKLFAAYAKEISKLEEQQQTVKTNLNNYKKRRKILPNFSLEIGENTEEFSKFVSSKYLPQIKSDLTSLSAGLKLLDNSLRTIEGIINIEQTKSNYNLSYLVGLTGLVLGLTGVTTSITSTQVANMQKSLPIEWKGVIGIWVISVVCSILLGLIVVGIWVLIKPMLKK